MGNINIETDLKDNLRSLNIKYQWVDIDPCFADTADFCREYGYKIQESANTIIIASKRGEKKYCACLVLASYRLDVNKKVKSLMDTARISFAKPDETTRLTNMMIGGVTVVGLPNKLPIYIDSNVFNQEKIIIGGGSRSGKIILSPTELLKIPNTEIIDGLVLPPN